MLTFAVVASRNGRPLDGGSVELFEIRARAEVPFPPVDSVTWTNDAGTVWFAGWQTPAAADDTETGWHVDPEGLTAVAGRLWPRCEGWQDAGPVPTQLARLLREEPLVAGTDALAGVFVVSSLARDGRSAVAADPVGLGLVYWGRSTDVAVISTRSSVAAAILAASTGSSAPRRDAFGTGWLAYAGRPVGSRSGYEDVAVAPPGAVLEVGSDGSVQLHRPPEPVWRGHRAALVADPEAALDQIRAEISVALRMARRDPDTNVSLGLTGGKDSRLILASLLADGGAGSVVCHTDGADDLPDVVIARQLASTFGLRHATNLGMHDRVAWRHRTEEALGDGHGSWREVLFRITAASTCGMRNVAQPIVGRLPRSDSVVVSGLVGETLRTNFPATTAMRTKEQAGGFVDGCGTAGILDRDALGRYRHVMHARLFDGITEHDSPQDVIDAFYLDHWLRRWAGAALEFDAPCRVLPLYSVTAIRLAFAIGAENRHAEWVHRRLLRRACEPLLRVPLATGDWPSGGPELTPTRPHRDPVPAAPPPVPTSVSASGPTSSLRTVLRDGRAKLRETDVAIMRRLFCADATNPAFELIDTQAAQRAVDGFDSLPERQRLELYGALSAVIWLGGHEVALPREAATA